MKTPSDELMVKLERKWVAFKAQLNHDEAQRLNENFDLVYGIAKGDSERTMSVLLKSVAFGVSIAEASAAKVADCFVEKDIYVHRDSDFDRWLPEIVPAVGPGNASTFELPKELNFKEIVEVHLGMIDSFDNLKEFLIKGEKCWSPRQVDKFIRQCAVSGENPLKLRTDGYANFFFIQVGNSVFAVYAGRDSDGWDVGVRGFADADRWYVGSRVSFRN